MILRIGQYKVFNIKYNEKSRDITFKNLNQTSIKRDHLRGQNTMSHICNLYFRIEN